MDITKVVFGLIGGLALFLYGMNKMSEGLQVAAGDRMRQVLAFLTKNPIMGALAGALVTAVLQSSSATTVMAIGFVSARLMTLPQAIAVIFGANIGTTMTAQLIAFKLSAYIYPIIFIGFFLNFAFKNEKVKNIGTVIFSFGLLFQGIEIMSSVMKPLASTPFFTDLMMQVSSVPVLGMLVGMLMTMLVQSSSATIAVLQNLASQPGADGISSVLGLAGAIPILLGDNIGTTITALIASIGQTKNAKRAAIAHSIFNISGSLLFLCFIPAFAGVVTMISPAGPETEVISRQIANAHTMFNVTMTLIWLPLLSIMVKIVKFIIRGNDEKAFELGKPQFLDEGSLWNPEAAILLISKEINHCANCVSSLIDSMSDKITGTKPTKDQRTFEEWHTAVGSLNEAISSYVGKLFTGGGLSDKQANQVVGLMFVAHNVGRISDRCNDIDTLNTKLSHNKMHLSDDAVSDLTHYLCSIKTLFGDAISALNDSDHQRAQQVLHEKDEIVRASKGINKSHLKRMQQGNCNEAMTSDYMDIVYCMDRAADNCASIAEEALEDTVHAELETITEHSA